jgi:acyl-CoA reductase-like NAD-dependent aldehyde dehydrogenase
LAIHEASLAPFEAQAARIRGAGDRIQGKPLAQSRRELGRSVDTIRALAALDLPIEVLKESATERILSQYLPLGVVAAITPWNSPMLLLMVKLAGPSGCSAASESVAGACCWVGCRCAENAP